MDMRISFFSRPCTDCQSRHSVNSPCKVAVVALGILSGVCSIGTMTEEGCSIGKAVVLGSMIGAAVAWILSQFFQFMECPSRASTYNSNSNSYPPQGPRTPSYESESTSSTYVLPAGHRQGGVQPPRINKSTSKRPPLDPNLFNPPASSTSSTHVIASGNLYPSLQEQNTPPPPPVHVTPAPQISGSYQPGSYQPSSSSSSWQQTWSSAPSSGHSFQPPVMSPQQEPLFHEDGFARVPINKSLSADGKQRVHITKK